MRAPFRQAPIREACTSCRDVAVLRCKRCGAALCQAHAPAGGRRCLDCETAYESLVNRPGVFLFPLGLWLATMIGAATVYGLWALGTGDNFIAWVSLLTITFVMTPFVVGSVHLAYGFVARRRFLAQHSHLSCVPVEYADELWVEPNTACDGWTPN